MTFEQYQKKAMTTELMVRGNQLSANDPAMIAKILGLVGEAGEVAEKFKKIVRDRNGEITEKDVQELSKELGDVLWYVSALSDYLGLSLEDVASENIEKLFSRRDRGVQKGSGDNR